MLSSLYPIQRMAHWRRLRQVVQGLFFVLFIFLLFAGLQRQTVFLLADFFFRIDPLSGITAMLASRAWIPRLGLALVTVAAALLQASMHVRVPTPTGAIHALSRKDVGALGDRLVAIAGVSDLIALVRKLARQNRPESIFIVNHEN